MPGPGRPRLLLLLALWLAGVGQGKGEKVQSKHCNMKTKFLTNSPCTSCAAFKSQVCPAGWNKNWEKGMQECSYTVTLGENTILMSGCSQTCWREVEEKACCPGYWGSECYECPGGASKPCNGHGTCLDGIGRNGTCVCEEGFGGFACQDCKDGSSFGPDCKSGCGCVHGVCKSGPQGDGSCLCFAGYTGPRCEQEVPGCKDLACPKNSQCVGADTEAPSCKCLPGYLLQGSQCQAQDPCSSFSCSPFATCSALEDGDFECQCKPGYHGDGKFCQPLDPCTSNYGGCPSDTTQCRYVEPGKSSCTCKPGLIRISFNISEGCMPATTPCRHFFCDSSATCKVDEQGKARCVCDEGEIGDGHSCYGHFIRELERLNSRRPNMRKLTAALSMLGKGCGEILSKSGPFTVLVPSLYLSGSLNESLSRSVCKLHIIPGQHMIKDRLMSIPTSKTLWTLAGESLTFTSEKYLSSGKIYKYKDQPGLTYSIIQPNLPASNGIFHLVSNIRKQPSSAFIQGDPEKSIGKILASMDVFSRFETILENCGLPSILEGPGPFTVFAPSNAAVDSLRDGRLIYLFTEGIFKLQELVKYHIYSNAQLTVDKLISLKQIQTMANQVVPTNITEEGRILLGSPGIPLKSMDIVASNGIIHLLDGILLPPSILPILPHRCNENQYKIVMGTCVDCQAQNTSVCPPSSQELNIFPKECVYIHDPDGLNVMKKGCARYCNQTVVKLGCCKGFFGPDCSQCPGGFSNPCYGKGNCSDGIQGNGACMCLKAFKGIACHVCADPNRHGEQCEEECGCVHGICDNRPGSGGVCQRDTCTKGFTGPFCNESSDDCGPTGLAQHCHPRARCVTLEGRARCVCPSGFEGDGFSCEVRHPCDQPDRGGCSENAQCIRGVPEPQRCVCSKGWKGDGKVCVAINPCEQETQGSCHVEAHCNYIGPGQSSCTCKPGFAGDGYECSLINPCLAHNGGCHVLATCRPQGDGRQPLCLCPDGYGGDGFTCYGTVMEELKKNDHFAEFYQWIKRAGFALPTRGNFTALVPSESAVQSLSPEDKAFWLQQQQLLHLLRAHFLPGALTTRQLSGLFGQEVTTLNPPTRWEITNSSGKITIQNVSVAVADILATNGVLHILNKVLLPSRMDAPPPRLSLRQQLDGIPSFSVFKELLLQYQLLARIEAAAAYTLFVPTNGSVEDYCLKANISTLDLDTVMRHVLLGEALTPDAMRPGMHRNSLLGSSYELIFYIRQGDLPLVNRVPVVGPTLKPQGGVVLGLGGVLAERPNICPRSHEAAVRKKCSSCERRYRCPSGYKIQKGPRESCIYLANEIRVTGCYYTCVKKIEVPDCCPGYFGTLCEPCPGGPSGNCSGHGQCQDGLLGNGECRCHEGFHGTACEGCELGRYGLDCAGVCNCGHGMCQDGLLGNGSCSCNVGWKGLRCDQESTASSCPEKCDPFANCINASCVCSAGYSGNGTSCSEVDPCAQDHGGCSLYANCTKVAPGQRTCTCKEGYAGDGELCLEFNRCPIKNGGCHAKAECVPTGPSQVACNCGPGYTGDGIQSCVPINPCTKDKGGCSPYASCNNTGPGQRTCTCGITTVGDGITCRTRISLELLRDKDAAFFSHYFMEYQELKGDGPFTVFVPKEDLMRNFTRRELATFSIHRQLLFRYHTVGCRRLLTQDLLEAGYVTTLSGHKLHFSQHEGSIYINEYAQVVAEDQLGVNGVLHFIDKLLLPPEVVHWTNTSSLPPKQNITEAAERWGYTIFSKLLTTAKMLPMFHDKTHQPFTVLWPTDEALRALPPERQAWLYHEDHREKLAAILRGHVIRHVKALASDIPNLGELRTMHGSPISFSCSKTLPGDLLVGEGEARIVQRHMEFWGGIAYGIDQLLEPAGLGSRCDHYVKEQLSTFRQYCGSCVVLPSCPAGYEDEGEVEFCLRESPMRRPFFPRYALYDKFLVPLKSQKPGCRRRCLTITWKPACCRGHYGIDCQVCPGGPKNPCNGNGVCSDGMTGKGACRCNSGFNGTACELCAAGAFGPRCQACQCTDHGQCDDGISGSGFCFCNEGWSGRRCEIKLDVQPVCSPPCDVHAVCRKDNICECNLDYEGDGHKCTVIDHCQNGQGGCSQHATCSQQGVVVTCTCHPDYEGDGVFCQAPGPCADGQNGGCSEHAECISTGPNTRRCECRAGYVGNGLQCLVEAVPPEDRCLETPGPCHPEAICTDLHFQEKRAGVFHLQSQEGKYKLTFREAEEQCKAQGAVLASLDQLSAAQQLGFHLCLMGWLSNGTVAYPSVYPSTGCDSSHVGIVVHGAQSNFTECWDAYCYRVHDVMCQCRDGFVGDGDTVCNGKLLDVLAANANFSTFYGLLLDYANTTQHGLEFLGFLSDELTFKTLFVPINSGFEDNVTLSWKDLELHASNVTFLSLNLSQSTILPAHSGHQLFISNSSAGNSTVFKEGPDVVRVSAIVEWDIIAFNGIIHAIESPLTVPPEPAATLARISSSAAVGTSTAVGVGLVLGLVALVFHYKIKGQGFQFHYFKAEDDEDDFSPWQEGPSPPLFSVPNPTFDGHDTFYEPFDDSLLEKEFEDTHRILEEE
ncbi:LOW QUALITY PROTEIN: stabilin-1 [Phascolarctos cinereus]|uniref:LOW QUALITY PROTEIN: stabilin-1 n=1 Tax=Phascolarctos cinereus TaxID=38626 RepID=A0A6P5J7H4_PHACI|nr:LOW QUALITY PROTEIN: stabilin-1 [Phascolarctos cinereus]